MYSWESFQLELQMIEDVDIRNLVSECLQKADPYFYEMPASTTGKYHPEYSLGEGGLVRHTKAAVKMAKDLLSLEQNQHLEGDVIIAALILHDIKKKGKDGSKFTTHDHPLVASEFVQEIAQRRRFTALRDLQKVDSICSLIESHMGQWCTGRNASDPVLPTPQDEAEKFVHTCDYLASRRYLTCEVK